MLPSGYIPCVGIKTVNSGYVDTGVYPKNTYTIDALFSGTVRDGYYFGARNTTSNTSPGQINLYGNFGNNGYLGYANQRINVGLDHSNVMQHFHMNGNELELVGAYAVTKVTGATTAFTGTRTMYIWTLNNGGSPASVVGTCCFHGMKIYENGELIHYFVPAYEEASGNYGVYDVPNSNFIALRSSITSTNYARALYRVTINASAGGTAYAKLLGEEKVNVLYGANHGVSDDGYDLIRLYASASAGYVFMNWTDSNGNVVSNENEFEYSATEDITLTANFVKKTDLKTHLGFKCMSISSRDNSESPSFRQDVYAEVISADIVFDGIQKSTSKFVLRNVPSAYSIGRPIFLFNPKGKCIYQGIIDNIDESSKTLSCREPMSAFDIDFLFHPNSLYSKSMLLGGVYQFLGAVAFGNNTDTVYTIDPNVLQRTRKFQNIAVGYNNLILLDNNKIPNFTMPPVSENTILNMEDYIMDLFINYGLFMKSSLSLSSTNVRILQLKSIYFKEMDYVDISDNVEVMSNVSLQFEDMETTVLVVFNSAGTSLRGYYGIEKDGTISTFTNQTATSDLQKYIGYNNYKVKVIMSDDDIGRLTAQYLTNAKFNHKITFDLSLDGSMFDIDSFKIGQQAHFYYKNKMYESIVTGLSYSVTQNDDVVHNMKVTLGKVRNNLTSKLNLGKVKK